MKKLISIVILVFNLLNCNSQNYSSIAYGKNGIISIPSDWKIYSEEWNNEITKKSGFNESEKKTILRTSDYLNSTIYLKLSTKILSDLVTKEELMSNDFLNLLNDDLLQTTQLIKSKNNIIKETIKAKTVNFGSGNGGVISYTYLNDRGKTRKTLIYTIIKGKKFYNLTTSWEIEKNIECEKIINKIKDNLIFSD
ncbi:hypothetical protein [Flavobacterium xinjiangense]|uniref:Uncharacterized protein n=1 Tax=Flavobacterium xinjiangense TaxID=178356 RepID=A0A1M7PUJ4_9FLAO|nr:hypothetical protein [Flavobacterium xinjiangense]SHN21134.1 hypothetical protein SAMN05216269_12318 [Flavobacterium xinjiangense]